MIVGSNLVEMFLVLFHVVDSCFMLMVHIRGGVTMLNVGATIVNFRLEAWIIKIKDRQINLACHDVKK